MSTHIRSFFFFSANIVHIYAPYLNRFQPSTRIRLYAEIFGFAPVPSSFVGGNPEMSMRIIAIWRHFFRAIATARDTARCKQSKRVVYHSKKCLNLLKKSRKSMQINKNGPMMKLNYC